MDNHLLSYPVYKKIKNLNCDKLIEIMRKIELKDKRGDGCEIKLLT